MTKLVGALMLSGALAFLPATVRAQYDGSAAGGETAAPATPAPQGAPPAPPARSPSAPAQAAPSRLPPGQWVYTSQYGWIWMPYGNAYSYVPYDGYGEPYLYVYYPVYGWCWISAPWVWGIGPWPWFGVWGPSHYGWYVSGWWREPWRWHYAPARSSVGFRGAPARAGGWTRAVPAGRWERGAAGSGRVFAGPMGRAEGGGFRGAGGGHMGGGRGGGHFRGR